MAIMGILLDSGGRSAVEYRLGTRQVMGRGPPTLHLKLVEVVVSGRVRRWEFAAVSR